MVEAFGRAPVRPSLARNFSLRYEATFGNEAGAIAVACPIAGLMGTSTRIEHMPPGLDNGKDALAAVPAQNGRFLSKLEKVSNNSA
jgi:hypothetical protein